MGEDDAFAVRVRRDYALAALALFVVEVGIALFVHDAFVRPYIGDVLAVMLVYAALRAVTSLGVMAAVMIALAIALGIEIAQALDLLGALGLSGNQVARTVLGGAFDWLDIAAYVAGGATVIVLERVFGTRGKERAA